MARDMTVPLLAKGGATTARLWTYVRDDRPFAGGAPPAALYYFSTDRRKEHPTKHLAGWTGILQGEEGHKTVRGTVLDVTRHLWRGRPKGQKHEERVFLINSRRGHH